MTSTTTELGSAADDGLDDAAGPARLARRRPEPVHVPGLRHSRTWIFATMLFSACLSLVAAFTLSYDAVLLAANPDRQLACDISSVLSCGTVALSWQASLFGFPNAFLGMMCEPVVITIAVAGLAGVRFPRWFMFTAQVIYLAGLVFALWLFSQSMWVIGALCPWCLIITLGTTLVFMTLLHHNILHDNLFLPPRMQERALSFVRSDADLFLTIGIVVVIVGLIFSKYGTALLS